MYLNTGSTASCHRASHSVLTRENFKDFHNTPQKLQARQTMLDGKWPSGGCEYCKHIEDAGGVSDRMYQSNKPGIPPELITDTHATVVTPVELEVFIDNTCNFKCIYCNGSYSSKIASEDKKFGSQLSAYNDKSYDASVSVGDLWPAFISWLKQHGKNLQRLNILGGEPLYQERFYELLDLLRELKLNHLDLAITTNLSVPKLYLNKFYDTMLDVIKNKGCKSVYIQCSVEGLGIAQEYVRNGFDTKSWIDNFELFHYQSPFKLAAMSTVNILVADDMLELANKINHWNKHKTIHWAIFDVLPTSAALNLSHHPGELYSQKFEMVLDKITNLQTRDQLQGILRRSVFHPNSKQKAQQLLHLLQEVDRRRNSNWQETFPWLTKYLESV